MTNDKKEKINQNLDEYKKSATSFFTQLSVGKKIGAILLIMVILAAINVGTVWQATTANEQAAEKVNIAGSNRLWTQRAGFISFMIKDGHPDQEMLRTAINRIDTNLQALDTGGTVGDSNIDPIPSDARDELTTVQNDWEKFKANAETVINEDPYSTEYQQALQYVVNNNNELLKESNDVVVAYTALPNSGEYSDEINIAGRQRMLGQRISKHVLAISTSSLKQGTEARDLLKNQDSEELQMHRSNLEKDINEFDAALRALESGGRHNGVILKRAPPSVQTEISNVKQIWTPFKQHAEVPTTTFRLNPEFWSSLAYIEENVDTFVDENDKLTNALAETSTNRAQSLRLILIGLLGLDIVVFLAGMFIVRRTITTPLTKITEHAEYIAKKDLSVNEVTLAGRGDEIGKLGSAFNDMLRNLKSIVQNLRENTVTVASSAEELAASNEETNSAAEEIASMIQEINDAAQNQAEEASQASVNLNNLAQKASMIASKSQEAEETSSNAKEKAEVGGEAAVEAMNNMQEIERVVNESAHDVEELGQKSQEIGKIVTLITEIAEQTNLLALNAAIEAARAGEQGKGFAVVAEEIRKLAEESTQAAGQIGSLIEEIQNQTGTAVESMTKGTAEVAEGTEVVNEALSALEEITSAVMKTSGKVQDISGAAQEQSSMVSEAVDSIDEISEMSMDTADNTENASAATEQQTASLTQVSESAQELSSIAEELNILVEEFKLEEEE